METGRSSSVYSAYSSVRSMPRTRPSLLTISDTTSPQPPCRLTRRRNAVSVIPAIGETTNGESRSTDPIFISGWPDIGCIHFDAHGLADEVDGQDETGVHALANQPADDAAERPGHHLHHLAFLDERVRVVGELALDKLPDALDLVGRNRRRPGLGADHLDDPVAREYRKPV